MSRNSSGTHSLPSGNPVVTGTKISSVVHNNTNNDLSAEITDSLSRSGKGGMSANLVMNSHKITGVTAGSASGDALSYGQAGASLATLALSSNTATVLCTNATANGDIIFGNDTADGSDNRRAIVRSGGSGTSTRGAFITLAGNEYGTNPGRLALSAGDAGSVTISGDTALTGALDTSGTLSTANSLVFTGLAAGDSLVGNSTVDGSDVRILKIRSGGSSATNRGAYVWLHGNDEAATPGRLLLAAGDAGSVVVTGSTAITGDISATGNGNISGDLVVGDDLSVTDDLSVGGDLVVTGSIRGAAFCSFRASQNYTASNITGNGADYTILYTEEWDSGADYDNVDAEFTAPIDGIYQFSVGAVINAVTPDTAIGELRIKVNGSIKGRAYLAYSLRAGVGYMSASITSSYMLQAGDIVHVTIRVTGMAGNDADIEPDLAAGYFEGRLVST